MRLLVLLINLCFWSISAFAWHDAGHRIVASIAYRQLAPAQRSELIEILRTHPRWQADFVQKMPDEIRSEDEDFQIEWLFQEAALWPDQARNFQGGDRQKFDRPTWHYVNIPLFLTQADRTALEGHLTINISRMAPAEPLPDMNVVQTILFANRVLADPAADTTSRALMLCWLSHDIGDIHQPLHSTAMFSRHLFPSGCRGGNLVKTKPHKDLHALWDSLPGGRIEPRTARNRALTLLMHSDLKAAGEQAATRLDASDWLDESHELAGSVVYSAEVLAVLRGAEAEGAREVPTITLSEEYLKRAGGVAHQRIVEAGFRLGAVLRQVLKH
jgi:hypothetical protein